MAKYLREQISKKKVNFNKKNLVPAGVELKVGVLKRRKRKIRDIGFTIDWGSLNCFCYRFSQ